MVRSALTPYSLGVKSICVMGGYYLFPLQDISVLSASKIYLDFKLVSPLKEIKLPIEKSNNKNRLQSHKFLSQGNHTDSSFKVFSKVVTT